MSRLADFFKTGGQYEHSPMMHVQDQKPNGTGGGAGVAGFNDRDINTSITNEIAGATLNTSTGEVTLPAGTYWIEFSAPAFQCKGSQSLLRKTDDTLLITGESHYTADTDRVTTSSRGAGQLTFTVSTTIKVTSDLFVAANAANLGSNGMTENPEVYTDLRIWQLDAIKTSPIIHDNKLYPLPGNTYVTGDMYGLEYSYTSANSITVDAGICYDSLNTTLLTGSASQVVAIGTTINQIYNLFLCDDGLVKTDTNVEGATLLAGSVTALRWIGFVLTDASGVLSPFIMSGNTMSHLAGVELSGDIAQNWTGVDITPFVEPTRIEKIRIANQAGGADVGDMWTSLTSGGYYDRRYVHSWHMVLVDMIYIPTVWFFASTGTFKPTLAEVTLKR